MKTSAFVPAYTLCICVDTCTVSVYLYIFVYMLMCMCVCMCVYVRARVCVCVRVRVCALHDLLCQTHFSPNIVATHPNNSNVLLGKL